MQQGPARAQLGHRPEADRRRPAHARRRARRQHPRPRPHAAADRRRRRGVHPDGRRRQALRTCSRTENGELFRLAIGGYGLFGIVTRVRLRLMPRTKIERVVEDHRHRRADVGVRGAHRRGLSLRRLPVLDRCRSSDTYLRKGVFSCYRPLPPDAAMPAEQQGARRGALARALLSLARRHPARLRGLHARTICRPRDSATGPTRASSASTSTTITRSSTAGCGAQAQGHAR